MPVKVIIYSRADCCLCDEARAVIEQARVAHGLDIEVREVDIDGDPELRARWNDEVPVIFVEGSKAFKYRVDAGKFVERVRRHS